MGISQKSWTLGHLGMRKPSGSKDRAASGQGPYSNAMPRSVTQIWHDKAGLGVAVFRPERRLLQGVACISKLQQMSQTIGACLLNVGAALWRPNGTSAP